ncbi:MAG: hypothetical protein IJX17_00760 [Clostridia bacterium]|nr:hypothetical protein [Clostridia bacterium]
MINRLLDLTNKNDEFEKYLESFENFQNKLSKNSTCLSCVRNFSNLEIILPKKILLTKLNGKEKSKIFFQCLIDFNSSFDEEIEFSLIVNDISIYKSNKKLNSGSNQVCIMQNYTPISSENLSVYIEISPLNEKTINLSMVSLFMWGKFDELETINYQALETKDYYLVSMLDNNSLYFAELEKIKNQLNFNDYNYINDAISYSISYNKNSDTIYLFRVDLMGNLFYSNLANKNEIFLTNNITKVSSSISNNGSILVSYIKNNCCYYFEITNNIVSVHKKLLNNNFLVNDCLCYYNKHRDKFCIIISTENESNYFIEQVSHNDCGIINISANYSISITLENL